MFSWLLVVGAVLLAAVSSVLPGFLFLRRLERQDPNLKRGFVFALWLWIGGFVAGSWLGSAFVFFIEHN